MMASKWVLVVCLASAGTGCLGSEAEREEQAGELAECRGGASDEQVQDNILITEEYALGLAADLEHAWTPVLFALDFMLLWGQTIHGLAAGTPIGWSHDADTGTYRYGSNTAAIEMRVLLTDDLAYGPAGTPVTEDVLSLDSFLSGAVVTADSETDTVTITYEQPGPLVALLGLGAAPGNPLVLDAEQRQAVLDRLATLALEPEFIAYGVTQSTLLDYHVIAAAQTISALAEEEAVLDLELVAVNASRQDPSQRLTTDSWQVERTAQRVSGYTTFTVAGGYFPYKGRVDFTDVPLTVLPERSLECLP